MPISRDKLQFYLWQTKRAPIPKPCTRTSASKDDGCSRSPNQTQPQRSILRFRGINKLLLPASLSLYSSTNDNSELCVSTTEISDNQRSQIWSAQYCYTQSGPGRNRWSRLFGRVSHRRVSHSGPVHRGSCAPPRRPEDDFSYSRDIAAHHSQLARHGLN